jgi:phosphoenolpyruvate synthase/pyruvate phosphate dikinase
MIPLVVGFADDACAEISIAGGKGANLARMTAARLPVPPGFCVTTEAYAQFIAANALDSTIAATVEKAGADATIVDAATASLRDMISLATLPGELVTAIEAGYAALAPPRTLPMHPSPACTTPTSTSVVPTLCSTRSAAAGHRCGRRGRPLTAPQRGSTSRRPGSAW